MMSGIFSILALNKSKHATTIFTAHLYHSWVQYFMLLTILSIVAILFYLLATISQGYRLAEKFSINKKAEFLFAVPALLTHAYLLHKWIDVSGGQNLSCFNMFSLAVWLVAVFIFFVALRKPITSLFIVIFPLAIFSILLILLFPQQNIINTAVDPKQLLHILFAALTFGVVCFAGLLAILLAILEKQLRQQPTPRFFQKLPALEVMEKLLFQLIWLGFLLLTLLIISSLFFFHHQVTLPLIQKLILTLLAWIIFGCLLLGRHYYGWRGRKAIYGTLIGVSLLGILYFGSILLLGNLL